jgi:hypothetical protein
MAAAVTLVVLLLPGAASAAPWAVKDTSGEVVGWTQAGDKSVLSPAGKWVGGTESAGYPHYGVWSVARKQFVGMVRVGTSIFVSGAVDSKAWRGKVTKRNGKWILAKKVNGHWSRRGSVAGGRGYVAAAALRLLLW